MTLKVGIIGIGGISGTHVPGWNASEHAEIAGAADVNPAALEKFGAEQGITKLYSDANDLINDPDIDIIDVCTPNGMHAKFSIAALNAGKHVLCEKPLAPTPGEIEQMIEARDKSGKMLMTAQHFRYTDTAMALKQEIETGVLGDIYHARAWMLRRAALPAWPGIMYKKNSFGGPCIDIGVHILDLTLWMMGNPKPVSVSGTAKTALALRDGAWTKWGGDIPKDMDNEDFAAAFVRFENGATLMLEVSWLLHHDTDGEDMRMWLYGDKGGSLWPKNEILSASATHHQLYNTQLKHAPTVIEAHAAECVDFAAAIAEGRPSPVPAEQSLQVMSILDGIYRSQAEGREIQL
ncbi:Gfo/Idh/MocA family oxidoreductase [Micrococcales bacterium 31B]|nr:Gfo/Idh/MocA family oxidoreductase [Micrococcales bacterium 31B]